MTDTHTPTDIIAISSTGLLHKAVRYRYTGNASCLIPACTKTVTYRTVANGLSPIVNDEQMQYVKRHCAKCF